MAPPASSTPESGESGTRAFARAVQGVLLERVAQGVVLMALVVIAAGFFEAAGSRRWTAVAIGVLAIVVTAVGWRRKWSDARMWLAMLAAAIAVFGGFALAVS